MRIKPLSRFCTASLIIVVMVSLYCSFLVINATAQETPHNKLGSTSTRQIGDAQTDLCAFCHTPYGKVKVPQTPNWYRAIQDQDAPTAFPTIGISASGNASEDIDVGPASLVCLTCHDGTQAQDIGGISPHPIPQTKDSTLAIRRQPPHLIRRGHRDRNNSHPVGVPYARGDARILDLPALASRTLAGGELEFHRPESDVVNQLTVWWIETGQAGRQKTDIQLYTRPDPISGDPVPYVECASCHDPHGKTPMLLRVEYDYGRLCGSCHNL